MNRLNLILLMILFMCITSVTGQEIREILVGGNMEDESAWTVYTLNSDVPVEYEFNYTNDTPSAGNGGGLWVYGETTAEINILFW